MSHSRRNTAYYKNLIIDGSKLNTGKNSSAPLAGMAVSSEAQVPQIEIVQFSGLALTVTDNGDASGGFNASAMFNLPSTRCLILGAFLDLTVDSIETGLLDGDYSIGVGVDPATDSSHTGDQVNLLGTVALTVASGTGTLEHVSGVILIQVDGTTAAPIYLNIGVPDASITADADITASGLFRMVYIDLSDGE